MIGSAGRAKSRQVSLHAARAPPPPRGCSASGGFRAGAGGNHPGWVGGVETTLKQSCPVVLGAICVRQSNDSRGADHIAYRSSRRSSSTWGPRHPLAVLLIGFTCSPHWGREPPVVVVSCWRRLCWAHAQHLEGLCGVCGCWGVRWPKPRGVGAGPPLCSSKDRERERGASPFTVVMILPQVHLRKPCYDFCFHQAKRFNRLPTHTAAGCPAAVARSGGFTGSLSR